jgi:type II secretory pathway component PulJ
MRSPTHQAYTLVELLIALTLSLLLLLGIAELFQRVGGSLNEARSVISTSTQLNEAVMLLRQDLAHISRDLAQKPKDIKDAIDNDTEAPNDNGYLEIIEGPDTVAVHPYVDENGNLDKTVGDVDDIIAFTVLNRDIPFRGIILEKIVERESAEIVWFVRGNTLYRRERLIDDVTARANDHNPVGNFPDKATLDLKENLPTEAGYATVEKAGTDDGREQRYDAVWDEEKGWRWRAILTGEDLSLRSRRFGHDGLSANVFPHPLYDDASYEGWRYLRMPIIEESDYWRDNNIPHWKTDSVSTIPSPQTPDCPNPDLWEQPYFFPSSLKQNRKNNGAVIPIADDDDDSDNPHRSRAGEDVVLTNVLSFDVKVWDRNTDEFVDLGAEGTIWDLDDPINVNNQPGLNLPKSNLPKELRTWDSWTKEYKKGDETLELPPYTEPLEAIQITIRCFDPASRIIKQTTVVHRFK